MNIYAFYIESNCNYMVDIQKQESSNEEIEKLKTWSTGESMECKTKVVT